MKAKQMSMRDVRAKFGDVLSRVTYGGETIVITKYGKPVAELRPLSAPTKGKK